MVKRKRNPSSETATVQLTAQSPSKKPKVDNGRSKVAHPSQSQKSGKPTLASPKMERKPEDTPQKSINSQAPTVSGLSKAAEKRKRQKKHARKLKKQAALAAKSRNQGSLNNRSAEQTSQGAHVTVMAGQTQIPVVETSVHKPKSNPPASKASSSEKIPSKQSEKAKGVAPIKGLEAEQSKNHAGDKGKALELPKKAPTGSRQFPSDLASKNISKRKRHRQKLYQARHGKPIPDNADPKGAQRDDGRSMPTATPSTKSLDSQPNESLLRKATQTTLLVRPTKQWIDESQPDTDTSSHRQVTETMLMPRPTKEWFEQDLPVNDTSQISNALANKTDEISSSGSEPAQNAVPQSIVAQKSPPSSPEHLTSDSPEEADRPFEKTGLPPVHQSSLERPPINAISSFSFASKRHNPAEFRASECQIAGLSGMRMDTGSIGSTPKPMTSLKASSVPSYSGRSDVKAAFQRFQKFTRGGESSDCEEESDSSESESENQAPAAPKASNGVGESNASAPIAQPESQRASDAISGDQTVPPKQPQNHELTEDQPQNDSVKTSAAPADSEDATVALVDTPEQANDGVQHDTSPLADSSASGDEDMENVGQSNNKVSEQEDATQIGTSQIPTKNPINDPEVSIEQSQMQPPSNGLRMQTAKDLPLFSDFNARHSSETADPALKRSNSFLGSDLGGSLSGTGQIDDNPVQAANDHLASQDLFKSIDDFSREVFGSIRDVPDCKPLIMPLESDDTPEPFVTDPLSDHGLNQKITQEQKTPDKATALNGIVRGSSPVVYIVNGTNAAVDTMLGVCDEDLSDNEEQDAGSQPHPALPKAESDCHSSAPSSLSSLTPSPPPPDENALEKSASIHHDEQKIHDNHPELSVEGSRRSEAISQKRRKMTGTTSKHFSPQKSLPRKAHVSDSEDATRPTLEDQPNLEPPDDSDAQRKSQNSTKKRNTGKTSEFFTPSPTKTPRPPKGTSTCPVPPTTSAHFGLIQEKLWREPFWLIIAVTFLNKTAGRSAAPIFWSLKELYPTPKDLALADVNHLVSMIESLGLQNQRAKRLILIAKTWTETPPEKSKRYRTLHYPSKNDGKTYKKHLPIVINIDDEEDKEEGEEEENSDSCSGALEIGHIPGCGPYAWDSWRIFCRDVLRGLATDCNGQGAAEGFEPEWQRVLPLDKELRACLRWMWLREGWIWNCETGERRVATREEMERARMGEMEIGDEGERRFARGAAEAEAEGEEDRAGSLLESEDVVEEGTKDLNEAVPVKKKGKGSRRMSIARRELDVESGDETFVPPPQRRPRRAKPAL